ncbi:hypothetical protein FS837_011148 [Tulasnella sp. UAMH 9824]|nr:hypothetical protein FS837_011148 [Tulasnella sp. UAMH 9824]
MVYISVPPGTNRSEFIRRLRREVQDKIPESVQDLIREQIIVVQYEKGVRGKRERNVVMDLAQVLPGVEPLTHVWKLSTSRKHPLRFAIFLSDFDEIPLARLLRTHRKTLSNAVLANSGEIRHLTNFACRNVCLDEKMTVAKLVEGYIQPFEGASLVLERDREAINAYEAEYEEAARVYRQEQSDLALETTHQQGFTADGTTAKDLTDEEEGRAIEGRILGKEETTQVDNREEESENSISQKSKRRREVDDQEDISDSSTSQPSASTSQESPKKRQRANDTILDPITSEDRNKWIDYILTSEETCDNHRDLLKEFISTAGEDRKWTIRQWDNYLKDNKKYITQQTSKVTGQLVE